MSVADFSDLLPGQAPDHLTLAPRTGTADLMKAAMVASGLLLAGIIGAAFIPLDGAVIAPGQIIVAGKPQPVQSLDPGLVSAISVREGDRVAAGQILLTLDPTQPRARLEIAMERLASALAEQARLLAESTQAARPDFTPASLPFAAPDLRSAADRQMALFTARASQRREARQKLVETEAQIAAQIAGLEAQKAAAQSESRLLNEDLQRQEELASRGLAREAPVNDLRRQAVAIDGRIASYGTEISRLDGARREAALNLAQEESQRAEEIALALRNAETLARELVSEIISLRDILARTELRAPVAGVVHELAVSAPGAMVAAGGVLAQIVPSDRALEIEVAVDPQNIDSLHQGQRAEVMIAAFDPRATGKLPATVTRIPPGAVTRPETGQSFYRVALTLDADVLPREMELRPGMPVQAFIATGERSLFSWLVAPLVAPLSQAMREN